MAKLTCLCGRKFKDQGYLTRHRNAIGECPIVASGARSAFRLAQIMTGARTRNEGPQGVPPQNPMNETEDVVMDDIQEDGVIGGVAQDEEVLPGAFTTRSGRKTRRTWRVEDVLPDEPGIDIDPDPLPTGDPSPPQPPKVRRVRLIVTDYVRTVANRFGVRRFFKCRPSTPLRPAFDLDTHYEPTADMAAAKKSRRTIKDIIYPYPNLSAFLLGHHFWTRGGKKTQNDRTDLQSLLSRDNFRQDDVHKSTVDFESIDQRLSDGDGSPWDAEHEGWKKSNITIGIPLGPKPTQASRQEEAATQRRLARDDLDLNEPAPHPIAGQPFTVEGFWHRSLCTEIKITLSSDPAAHKFIYDPYHLEFLDPLDPTRPPERIYGELYNAPVWVDEDLRLQNSPPEPGCNLPRAIVAMMAWTDETMLAQFGHAKGWPGYLYYGNQDKYMRTRPTSHAGHHVAFFPKLPDAISDYIRQHAPDKRSITALLTHCRRELFHGAWVILLDDEFIEAYHHGMIIDCADGVRRRIYPRLFTYSADYPEKVLVATIRDKGGCPCPQCLIRFDDIPGLGTPQDSQTRKETARHDDEARRKAIEAARSLIYDDGYVVNSKHVENLLKPTSLVPTTNAFSLRLQKFGLDYHATLAVDLMHEFELGIWKSVLTHLIRILDAQDPDLLRVLDERFRQVPPFSGIRKFTNNVSDLHQLMARDYEDILQCSIPCFDGLLPAPHDEAVQSLIYTMAHWHALAKMRMHTDTSLALLEDVTTALGVRLRRFAAVTSRAFNTRETKREYAARIRTQATQVKMGSGQNIIDSGSNARRPCQFNMKTIKVHFLGDYVDYIRSHGTTDSYTTQIGEHQHRVTKAWYARTNFRSPEAQLVKINIRESRLRLMAHQLRLIGVDVPGDNIADVHNPAEALPLTPQEHHQVAIAGKHPLDLQEWMPDDGEARDISDLSEHVFQRLRPHDANVSADQMHAAVVFVNNCIYPHATLKVNYTSYDLERGQDVVHPSAGKPGILVYSPGDDGFSCPWEYAWVNGIYHTQVYCEGLPDIQRMDFLRVRWFDRDFPPSPPLGPPRLERVSFAPPSFATGFVDPASVIRGCHIIPAFRCGSSVPQQSGPVPVDAWNHYYVDRFADCDTTVCFIGTGVGHLRLKSVTVEKVFIPIDVDPNYDNLEHSPGALGGEGEGSSEDFDEEDEDFNFDSDMDLDDLFDDVHM
ncbi:hypothetical protein OF83DRAFT_1089234 [Amylostereum chailletii]|nr:hypothetical protein OF83DRAFT_1089234 [Amylostereum chailletii]